MEIFKDYAYFYNMLYNDKNYAEEAKQVQKIINTYSTAQVGSILDIGSGTGRHDEKLNELGYTVKGIDLSEAMIEVAQKSYSQNRDLSFEVGDARTYRTSHKFDAVISLFHVMSYQNETEQVLQVMKTANEALKSRGGIFVFDLWYGPGVLTERPETRMKRIEDEKYQIIRYANPIMYPNKNLVDVCYDIFIVEKETDCTKEINEIHSMRYFFKPEIEYYLDVCGFELVGYLDCNTFEVPGFDTWTCYFIAKRK